MSSQPHHDAARHRAGISDQPADVSHDILAHQPAGAGALSPEQLNFIETFGFLHLPGLITDLLPAIIAAFSETWDVGPDGLPRRAGDNTGELHDDSKRSYIVPFIDQHPVLCALLDDERIEGVFASLLGADWVYLGSDGNFFVGDTDWHSDSDWGYPERPSRGAHGAAPRRFVKMAFYLDEVTRAQGALRVM
eukprot:SAG22_NODE_1677_length_3828_cov_2.539019_4_plen_192_part_00